MPNNDKKRRVRFQEISNRTKTQSWVSNGCHNLRRGPLVRSHSIFDGEIQLPFTNYQILTSSQTKAMDTKHSQTHHLETPQNTGFRWFPVHLSFKKNDTTTILHFCDFRSFQRKNNMSNVPTRLHKAYKCLQRKSFAQTNKVKSSKTVGKP